MKTKKPKSDALNSNFSKENLVMKAPDVIKEKEKRERKSLSFSDEDEKKSLEILNELINKEAFVKQITILGSECTTCGDKMDRYCEIFDIAQEKILEEKISEGYSQLNNERNSIGALVAEKIMRIYDMIIGLMASGDFVEETYLENVNLLDDQVEIFLQDNEKIVVKTPLVRSRYHSHNQKNGKKFFVDYSTGIAALVRKKLEQFEEGYPDFRYKHIEIIEIFSDDRAILPDADNLDTKKIVDEIVAFFTTKDSAPFTSFYTYVMQSATIDEGTYFIIHQLDKEKIVPQSSIDLIKSLT